MPVFICQGCGTELTEWSGQCPKCGVSETIRLNQNTDRLIDKVIKGRYKIVRKLGQGGMGAVYLAEQVGIGHRVALKFLKAEFSDDPDLTKRFLNEAKTYARVAHPNAVTFHDFGQDEDGNLFIAMEYCDGVDLKKVLHEKKRLPLPEAIDITLQVADVLGNAHTKGVVHRDLKPENIMLRIGMRGIHVTVLDFGIARLMNEATKLTMQGAIAGTPRYMSPEQVEGKLEVDSRADIYALGILLYEMLTGVQPIDGMTIAEILRKQVQEPIPHLHDAFPELDFPEVDQVIQKATSKNRDERFPDMMSLASQLAQAMPTQAGKAGAGLYAGGLISQNVTPNPSKVGQLGTPAPTSSTSPTAQATAPNAHETAATYVRSPTEMEREQARLQGRPPRATDANMSIGGISPAKNLTSTAAANESGLVAPARSRAPLIGALVVVAAGLAVGGWLLFKPAQPTIVVTPPPGGTGGQLANDVKPPEVKPPEVKPPEIKPPEVDTDAIERERTVQRGRDNLARATTAFSLGNLHETEVYLHDVPEGTPSREEADEMVKKLDEINKRLRAGDQARAAGNCDAALPNYNAVLKINPAVAEASQGASRCRAAALPGTLE